MAWKFNPFTANLDLDTSNPGDITGVTAGTGLTGGGTSGTVTLNFDTTYGDARYIEESQAAGGDLSGTYPNPSVTDDSHAHTSTTVTGPIPITVDTKANILASAATSGKLAFSSDTYEFFSADGTTWRKAVFTFVTDTSSPDMGYLQDTSRIGIQPTTSTANGWLTDYIFANCAVASNSNTTGASTTRIPIRASGGVLQMYSSTASAWQTIVANYVFSENSSYGYALEHTPVGYTTAIEIMSGNSLNSLGLNGFSIIQGYSVSMGAYPPTPRITGRSFA